MGKGGRGKGAKKPPDKTASKSANPKAKTSNKSMKEAKAGSKKISKPDNW